MNRRAFTLVEVLVCVLLVPVLIGIAYGLFHLLFWSGSRSNVTGLTRRSFIQKDTKVGLRRLTYRLRESIQILSPTAGASSSELVFRDITNTEVRLRHIAAQKRVLSERQEGGGWVEETEPQMIATGGGPLLATWPVRFASCPMIRFTAISSDCVTVHATMEWEGQLGSFLTVIKLRNAGIVY